MLKNIFVLFFVVLALASCKSNSSCGDKICDASFASISVQFIDSAGGGINVEDFSAVHQRTGDTIEVSTNGNPGGAVGSYIVIDDNYLGKLDGEGEDIVVSGTHPATNQTKTAVFKVAGGECACHISKIEGPDQIQFD